MNDSTLDQNRIKFRKIKNFKPSTFKKEDSILFKFYVKNNFKDTSALSFYNSRFIKDVFLVEKDSMISLKKDSLGSYYYLAPNENIQLLALAINKEYHTLYRRYDKYLYSSKDLNFLSRTFNDSFYLFLAFLSMFILFQYVFNRDQSFLIYFFYLIILSIFFYHLNYGQDLLSSDEISQTRSRSDF